MREWVVGSTVTNVKEASPFRGDQADGALNRVASGSATVCMVSNAQSTILGRMEAAKYLDM